MAGWEDVRRLALALPGTDEHASYGGAPSWRVKGKAFCWERPLARRDLEELGERAPTGPVLGAAVPDEAVKHALTAGDDDVYFTTSHFEGYAAVLVRLDRVGLSELEALLADAWRAKAPARLRAAHPAL